MWGEVILGGEEGVIRARRGVGDGRLGFQALGAAKFRLRIGSGWSRRIEGIPKCEVDAGWTRFEGRHAWKDGVPLDVDGRDLVSTVDGGG